MPSQICIAREKKCIKLFNFLTKKNTHRCIKIATVSNIFPRLVSLKWEIHEDRPLKCLSLVWDHKKNHFTHLTWTQKAYKMVLSSKLRPKYWQCYRGVDPRLVLFHAWNRLGFLRMRFLWELENTGVYKQIKRCRILFTFHGHEYFLSCF